MEIEQLLAPAAFRQNPFSLKGHVLKKKMKHYMEVGGEVQPKYQNLI